MDSTLTTIVALALAIGTLLLMLAPIARIAHDRQEQGVVAAQASEQERAYEDWLAEQQPPYFAMGAGGGED